MHSLGINGAGELRGKPANPDSPRKMAAKTKCVCKILSVITYQFSLNRHII